MQYVVCLMRHTVGIITIQSQQKAAIPTTDRTYDLDPRSYAAQEHQALLSFGTEKAAFFVISAFYYLSFVLFRSCSISALQLINLHVQRSIAAPYCSDLPTGVHRHHQRFRHWSHPAACRYCGSEFQKTDCQPD